MSRTLRFFGNIERLKRERHWNTPSWSSVPMWKRNYWPTQFPWSTKRPCDEWTKNGENRQIRSQIERAWEKILILEELRMLDSDSGPEEDIKIADYSLVDPSFLEFYSFHECSIVPVCSLDEKVDKKYGYYY